VVAHAGPRLALGARLTWSAHEKVSWFGLQEPIGHVIYLDKFSASRLGPSIITSAGVAEL